MKIERIGEKKIKVTVSLSDLKERNIDLQSLTYNSAAAQELLWDMMEQAESQYGFDFSNVHIVFEPIADFAEGKIPEIIDDSEFNGEFNRLAQNFNQLALVSKMRGEDINSLIRSAEEGILDARGDQPQYPGHHGSLLEGINKIIDAYIMPINVSADYIDRISNGDLPPKITDAYRGDFNEIKNNLNSLIDVIHMRNADIGQLIQAALDGRLDFRADPSKYPGENGRMIEGINLSLIHISEPTRPY